MFNYKGKVVAITGSSSGLGLQMAEGFASVGADLVLLARRMDRLEENAKNLTEKYGVKVLPVACDVTNTESIQNALKAVDETFGHVEVIVNNAGGVKGTGTPLVEYNKEDWEFTINLDLTSVFEMTKFFAGYMKKNIEAGKQTYGRVINIASILAQVGNVDLPTVAYHSSKGAVANFTKAAAAELATSGITCNCICPGYFITELTAENLAGDYWQEWVKRVVPVQRFGNPGDLNPAAVFLGAEESSYVTGQVIAVDGGYLAI